MSLLKFMMEGVEVKRFHTKRTLTEDTVGTHAASVALLVMMLTEFRCSAALLMAALTHDHAEQVHGDVPSPTKRMTGVGALMDTLEANVLKEQLGFEHVLTSAEERVLTLADRLSGMYYCAREKSLGNKGLSEIFHRYNERLEELTPFSKVELDVMDDVDNFFLYGELK